MNETHPQDTRGRILEAAERLSCEVGPAHVSLDAVAARAGVSKGGLLYHFPSKHDLLKALVAAHVDGLRRALGAAGSDCPLERARAYLRMMRAKLDEPRAPVGLFAAIAEDPEFVEPLRAFRRSVLEDAFGRCPDPALASLAYLACEGLVFQKLLDPQGDHVEARERAFDAMERLMDGIAARAADAPAL